MSYKVKSVTVNVERTVAIGSKARLSTSFEYCGLYDGEVEVKDICTMKQLPKYIDTYAYTQYDGDTDWDTVQWVGFKYVDAENRETEDTDYLPLHVFVDHMSTM